VRGAFLKHLEKFRNFLRGMKLADIHLQKLNSFVTVVVQRRVVYLQKLQASFFKHHIGSGLCAKRNRELDSL